ncbi:Protein phosphatase 2C 6 [Candidozyma auris]|nr:type 2C protein phosphatase PTC6 [[Candida] auris]QEO19631.1 hypothetical_protein [[Candida] auris]GBL50386.1 hypothetical protein CAJCM15448_26600 [[Candida] auris]
MPLERLRQVPSKQWSLRCFSTSVTFTSVDRSSFPVRSFKDLKPNAKCKLRVPLLKSPSHLGHYTSRMNRRYNEDKYSACVLDINGRTIFNFNIFDGHGGDQCSKYLSYNLGSVVEESSLLCDANDDTVRHRLIKDYAKNIGGYWRRWYKQRQQNFEKMVNVSPQVRKLSSLGDVSDDLPLRLPLSFLQTDYDFFNQEDNKSGSTCTSLYMETLHSESEGEFQPVFESYYFNRGTINKLTVAHVGDTKAILVDKNGDAHPLTLPHHPSNPTESSRLRRYSANYFMTDSFGEERFISLANTRAFGDLNFKEVGVTAEPEVSQLIFGDHKTISKKLTAQEIKDHTIVGLGGDESFLVLCTDGITNEVTDQEVADIIMTNFNMRGQAATPQVCAEEVVKFVEYIGGDDNATCLVIRLSGWGNWPVIDRTGHLRQERLNAYSPRDRGSG